MKKLITALSIIALLAAFGTFLAPPWLGLILLFASVGCAATAAALSPNRRAVE